MSVIAINPALSAQLKRSARRTTIAIKIQRGKVIVSAPVQAPLRDVQRFVQKKALWITKHLQKQQQQLAEHTNQLFQRGDTLFYLGQALVLTSHHPSEGLSSNKILCDMERSCLSLCESTYEFGADVRKGLIERWYVQQAIDYLKQKVTRYAATMKLSPRAIKVRHYKTRWGSCNSRGELQFNWLIMMAPPEVIDYVVVHELAHLKHFNHSEAFWRVVESVTPQHLEYRAWLRRQTTMAW